MSDVFDELLRAVAQQLANDGVGDWNPSGISAAEWPITLYAAPATSTGKAITLRHYRLGATPGLTETLTGINVLVRGDRNPATAGAKAHDVYLSLQGRTRLPDGVLITQLYWSSETQLGPDGNGREERSINYYVQHNVASPGAT